MLPDGGTDGGHGGSAVTFVERLPPRARGSLDAWRAAHAARPPDQDLPNLFGFAPHRLPPEVLPWVMLMHERADGELVYGLMGEEVRILFGENRRGWSILHNVPPAERRRRLGVIRASMDQARPVWLTGRFYLEGQERVGIGRLALPVRTRGGRGVLLIYFLLEAWPQTRPRRALGSSGAEEVFWCPDEVIRPAP